MPRKATGTLIWHRSGWHARYWATKDGERVRAFVDLETKNELLAKQKLAELVRADGDGAEIDQVETFAQAAERILTERLKTLSSARAQLSYMRVHINPVIGRIPAVDVTKADVMSVLDAVRDQGLAQQTLTHVRNAIATVFKQLKREGVIEVLPVPSADDLPEVLPDAIDDRPKAVLTDDELLVYLAFTEPREAERFRGAVRERQLMALLSRCVGGMRTAELHGLTWARAHAEGLAFDALEVVRYKTRRKAARRGSKAVSRQLYPLADTVLPAFLRFWYLRYVAKRGEAPSPDAVLFPVRRARREGEDRVGEQRNNSAWASALRRDLQRAFEANQDVLGVPPPGSRRWLELFEGTEDRRPLWFHNSRNAAAVAVERIERLKASARFTGHASASMLQHYLEQAGEVNVVPVLPEFLPDADTLRAILLSWCEAEGIDADMVLNAQAPRDQTEPNEKAYGKDICPETALFDSVETASHETENAVFTVKTSIGASLRKRLLYPAELRERICEAGSYNTGPRRGPGPRERVQ